MKHLQLFENFSEDELKRFLQKAVKRGDITINVDVDELVSKHKVPKVGTFEYFIEEEGKFISIADSERMTEYVAKLKEMGLNVSYLERMLPDYVRYHKITYLEDDLRSEIYELFDDEKDQEDEIEKKIEVLLDEQNNLIEKVEDFERELKKMVKKAKEI